MARTTGRLLLVGCGKMGGALLDGWLADRAVASVVVVEPNAENRAHVPEIPIVSVVDRAEDLPADTKPDAIVFAVKPQVMDEVVPHYRAFAKAGAVTVSIAAGRTIHSFEKHLGADAAIVRAMPNTPAAVGRGITAACPNAHVSAAQRMLADRLLEAVGAVEWIDTEAQLDAVTAVSGSGPAYVFLLAETMAAAGIAAGLPEALAARLARATVAGAGELLHRSEESASQLRINVTSPGGTTAAALDVLMGDGGLAPLMRRAVADAAKRSRELAG